MTAPNWVQIEVPRDHFGRPMLIGPSGDPKRIPYQRVTTFIGVLENMWNLMEWKKRQVTYGMGQRPDLVLASAAAHPNDKTTLGKIADQAMEAALSSAAATTGTALHSLTERVDRGSPLGVVPEDAEASIRAYEAATRHLDKVAIEEFRVLDDWRVAGTADRIVAMDGHHFIADVKTGSIDYPHKIAMQLAAYAHGIPYDIETDTRRPQIPELNLARGIIIHLPAGQGECFLHFVDIEKGWRGCQLAKKVWDWRKVNKLTWEVVDDDSLDRGHTYAELALMAATVEELRVLWKEAHRASAFSSTFVQAVEQRRRELGAA